MISADDPTGWRILAVQTFTDGGATWTPPPGTRTVKVYVRPAEAGPPDITDPPAQGGHITVVSYG